MRVLWWRSFMFFGRRCDYVEPHICKIIIYNDADLIRYLAMLTCTHCRYADLQREPFHVLHKYITAFTVDHKNALLLCLHLALEGSLLCDPERISWYALRIEAANRIYLVDGLIPGARWYQHFQHLYPFMRSC